MILRNDFSHVKRVAILGAGVAGLQTARHLGDQGLSCTLFEKDEEVAWLDNPSPSQLLTQPMANL